MNNLVVLFMRYKKPYIETLDITRHFCTIWNYEYGVISLLGATLEDKPLYGLVYSS